MSQTPVATEAQASPAATGGPSAADWALMLEPGETMLWWGRPLPGGKGTAASKTLTMIGALFAFVGAVFLPIGLLVQAETLFTVIFTGLGAIFVILGLGMILVPRLQQRKEMRASQYALSDRRALVYDGRQLHSWLLTPGMRADYLPGDPGSIIFGAEELALTVNNRPIFRDLGFLRIADAAEVMAQIRQLQLRPEAEAANAQEARFG